MAGGSPTDRRVTALLVAATLGVYALIMVGATTAIVDAAAACPTWPTCNGALVVAPDRPLALIAWGHRLAALVVGGLVVAATVGVWLTGGRRRVRWALAGASLLYPFQAGLGALTVVLGESALLSRGHLVVGMTIFAGFLAALAWRLEAVSPAEDAPPDASTSDPLSRDPAPAPPADAEAERDSPSGWFGTVKARALAYLSLTKPRLMWLLCLVAAAGMALAAGPGLGLRVVATTLLGGVLAIGASGTFNNVLERDVDRRMRRTADRPVATDRVGVRRATAFGLVLTVLAVATFLSINLLAAVLGLAAILYYSVVYTLLLKPNTVKNTVIGGLAGSFPALIGAAAATNTVGLPALLLAAVIFLWTPAHFYNLALAYRADYERGGFPMLPVVHGARTTHKHILLYAGATFLAASLLAAVGELGWIYAATGVGFGAGFLYLVVRLHREATRRAALRSFYASNAYLGALLVAILLDTLVV